MAIEDRGSYFLGKKVLVELGQDKSKPKTLTSKMVLWAVGMVLILQK